MRRWSIVVMVLVVLLVALVWWIAPGKHNKQLRGIYVTAFERSDFYPGANRCPPSGVRYWLLPETTADFRDRLDAIPASQNRGYKAVEITFVGDVSALGSYGHLGQYRREVRVTKLLEISNADGCQ